MPTTHHRSDSHNSNNRNAPRNARRRLTFLAAVLVAGMLAAGFMAISGLQIVTATRSVGFGNNINWSLVATDYTVTTTGNAIIVTDISGNTDTLTMSEPSVGNIKFAAPGRNFSVNGGANILGDSGNLSLTGINNITVNQGGGDDTFNAGAFTPSLPSLTINGGVGNDRVNFTGNLTFASNSNLDVDLQNDDPSPGIDSVFFDLNTNVILSGTGAVTIKVSQKISFTIATVQVVNGDITLEANQQAVATSGDFLGVQLSAATTLTTSGTGKISLKGKGGADATTSAHMGVLLQTGSIISSTSTSAGAGTITLDGTGGLSTDVSRGVQIQNTGTAIESSTGNISISGHGAATAGNTNWGVSVITAALVRSSGAAKITINGTGGNGSSNGIGVVINGSNAQVTSVTGDISITGQGGNGGSTNFGVNIQASGAVRSTGAARITIDGTAGDGTANGFGARVAGANSQIASSGGDLSLIGRGGNGSGAFQLGVSVESGGRVTATGAANVSITGTGGSGTTDNYGVDFDAGNTAGTGVSAANGNIQITGVATDTTGTNQDGVRFEDSLASQAVSVSNAGGIGAVAITGTAGNNDPTSSGINIVDDCAMTFGAAGNQFIADTMDIGNSNVTVNAPNLPLLLRQKTNNRAIDLGGADSATQLGLTDAELDVLAVTQLNFGDVNSGAVTVSAPITRPGSTTLSVTSGANIDIAGGSVNTAGGNINLQPGSNVFPSLSGVDVITGVGAPTTIVAGKALNIVINGVTFDSGYTQFNAQGEVGISSVDLQLSGSYTPAGGDSFIIVNNDGTDAITGTFSGLPEGATVNVNGTDRRITYIGGDGNDVVLGPLVGPNFVVTKTADTLDGTCDGDCSLREAIAAANANADTNAITFAIPFTGMSADPGCTPAGVCTITLGATPGGGNGELAITSIMNIVNTDPVGTHIIVSGGGASRVFNLPTSAPVTVAMTSLTITGGATTNVGGGIYNLASILTLTDVSIGCTTFCTGGNAATNGGGIFNGNVLTVINSTISNNAAANGGGGIFSEFDVNITNSTVSNNTANGGGGGILVGPGTNNVTNSTISGNSISNIGPGGGIFVRSGTLKLTNCTLSNNSSSDDPGGGISVSGGAVSLINTIVAGNNPLAPPAADADVDGSVISLGHNLIGISDGTNGFTNGSNGDQVGTVGLPIVPLLGPLMNNGGPTFTHNLLNLSPAIDAGDDCVFTNLCSPPLGVALTTDQRGAGFSRLANGDTVAGAQVDIGAFEKQAPSAASGSISGHIADSDGNAVPGVALRVSGTQNRLAITDNEGNYHFDEVASNGFYTVTPARVNYSFAPGQRSFSQLGQTTEAVFTASTTGGTSTPLDTTEYFVRQQYLDFLGREPDEAGLNFWVNNIAVCRGDSNCLTAKRTDTSAAFFLSTEFQQTGYLVYRMYQSAYGDLPGAPVPVRVAEFRPDTQVIGHGVIVNQSGWEAKLEANKQAFASEFVVRARFTSAYPTTISPTEFVDRLFLNADVTADAGDRVAAINEFGGASDTVDAIARARVLRRVADNATLSQQKFNQAFVLMQYFGYLGRDPNSGPDTDFSGYNFWLNKLDNFNGDFRRAEMVKAFLIAGEYRGRFPR